MLYSTTYASLVGPLTLAGDGENLVGLWMEGDRYFADTIAGRPVTENKELPLFATVKNWLDAYFAGERPAISALPLAPAGTPFQKLVYDIMRDIPYGQCTTYGAIARQAARMMNKKRMSGQAVGGAVGRNPISIIIPCHRVVGANGNLTGYGGGIPKKYSSCDMRASICPPCSSPQGHGPLKPAEAARQRPSPPHDQE